MANVLISFLGTGNYEECLYRFGDTAPISSPTKYIQEAILSNLCLDWTEHDRVLIFSTPEARKANWDNLDSSANDGSGSKLGPILESVGTSAQLILVPIVNPTTQSDILNLFMLLLDHLEAGDNVTLDITHAYRTIPLLSTAALNYAKATKNIKVEKVLYGAYEAREESLDGKSVSPVYDLSHFDELSEWVVGVERFVSSGDVSKLITLTRDNYCSPILKETQGQDIQASKLRHLVKALETCVLDLQTARGKNVTDSIKKVNGAFESLSDTEMSDIAKLVLNLLENRLPQAADDPVSGGISAARWCIKFNLYQQAVTLVEETLKTFLANKIIGSITQSDKRELASQSIKIATENLIQDKWYEPAKNFPDEVRLLLKFLESCPELKKQSRNLKNLRNDFNHAGYGEHTTDSSGIIRQAKDLTNNICNILEAHMG